jgi:uncharacterized protein
MKFEWDPNKEAKNVSKHKVSFHEAATVFGDPLSMTVLDPDHSAEEDRYAIIGWSSDGRLLIIAHSYRNNRIRIISARELTRKEKEAYEQRNQT